MSTPALIPEQTVLRARTKPKAEMPEWALCCEKMSRTVGTYDGVEVLVYAPIFTRDHICPHCSREKKSLRCRKLVTPVVRRHGTATHISVDCFEFDEGIATPTGA